MKVALDEYEAEWAKDSLSIFNIASEKKLESKLTEEDEKSSAGTYKIQDPEDVKSGTPVDDDLEKDREESQVPAWAKSIYREIARKTHPDIVKNEDLNRVFSDAASIVDGQKYDELIDIALDLDVDIKIGSAKIVEKLSIKSEIDTMEKSLPWLWGESYGIPELRYKIAIEYLKSRGVEPNASLNEEVESFIRSIETD